MYLAQKCYLLEDTIFTSPTADGIASLNGHPSQLIQAPEHWFGPRNQNPILQSSALQKKLTLPWSCSKYILTVNAAYFCASRQK